MKPKRLFSVIPCPPVKGRGDRAFCIGLELSIGEERIPCPVTEACGSYEELSRAAEEIKGALDRTLGEAREGLFPPAAPSGRVIGEDMAPEVVWAHLSTARDEETFAETFNHMAESLRRKVAEHILTKCNIFSGKGAVFSSRYNNVTGLLD